MSRTATISTIAGITKFSVPNTIRQTTADATPMSSDGLFVLWHHISTNMTRNIAVMAKSIPLVSKLMLVAATAPTAVPSTQYRWFRSVISKRNDSSSTPSGMPVVHARE